jgi:hypothetical protein
MKLNTNVLSGILKNKELSQFLLSVGIWTFIGGVVFAPGSRFITERVLEQSVVHADEGTAYTLSRIDYTKTKNEVTAEELQGKVFKNTAAEISSESSFEDGRIVAMRKFLLEQNSPMMPYAKLIVTEADKYGSDWRLIVGISGVESKFGKVIPQGSYNAWGWRGGPGGDWSRFDNWEHAIKHLTERMALGYGRRIDPFDIESVYCPPCGATGQHYWARAVVMYMNQLNDMVERNKLSHELVPPSITNYRPVVVAEAVCKL